MQVHVAGRDFARVQEIVAVSQMRAQVFSTGVSFTGSVLDWDHPEDLSQLMDTAAARIVLHLSSLQSPWDLDATRNKWSDIVRKGGFGITLPLQARLAMRVAQTLKRLDSKSLLINACYPDAVNPLLRALGFTVFCGIGNIAILAAAVGLSPATKYRRRIVAHHAHLGMILNPSTYPAGVNTLRIWHDDKEVRISDSCNIEVLRSVRGAELNQISGWTGAVLIRKILSERTFTTHVPGPAGLPGGYPVQIRGEALELDLPPSFGLDEAISFNRRSGAIDGVTIGEDGTVTFSDLALSAIRSIWTTAPDHIAASQIDPFTEVLLGLKQRLDKS